MTRRSGAIFIALAVAIAGFKGGKLVLRAFEVPSCHSKEAIKGMIEALKDPALGTLAVNNATTISGGPFARVRDCTADIAPLRGGVEAADMRWMRVTYEIVKSDTPDGVHVTAALGGATSLAPERSGLKKWIEYLLD
jgi:hypothetical protein